MGFFDKLKKDKQQESTAPKVINEVETDDKVTVFFDDGSSMDWKKRESHRVIFNLDAAKVPSFSSDRVELEGGMLTEGEKSLSYILDGVKVFEISSRTKSYKDLEEWRGCSVRKLIAERHDGTYGAYYKVWMYFGDKRA